MATNKPELASARWVSGRSFAARASVLRFRRIQEQGVSAPPQAYLHVQVDGRVSSYFEWLGAGIYCPDHRGAAQNGRRPILRELHYGFGERCFYLRIDPMPDLLATLGDFEFRIKLRGSDEVRLLVAVEGGKLAGWLLDTEDLCLLGPHELVGVAFDKILELCIARRLLQPKSQSAMTLEIGIWADNLLLDVLPIEGSIEVKLGTGAFAWPAE